MSNILTQTDPDAAESKRPAPAQGNWLVALARRNVLAGLTLALLTAVVFAPVCSCGLVDYDDPLYTPSQVQDGLTTPNIGWAFTTFQTGNWHPLTWLSLQADVSLANLFDGSPMVALHRTNLLLHVLNVVLLYLLLVRMTDNWPWSALAAALFALHPLRVESVAWVSERKDVLSTFFGLLALLAYVRFAQRSTVGVYLLLVLLYAASLAAKPMLVTLPCLLLLLDYWPLRRVDWGQQAAGASPQPPFPLVSVGRLLLEKLPLLVVTIAACVITIIAQRSMGNIQSMESMPFSLRASNALDSVAAYLRQTIWPVNLAVIYPYPRSGISPWLLLVDVLLIGGITAVTVRFARSRPYLLVGWLWFLGTLIPVIGLVQVGWQARADRYTYVPHMGLFLAVVWGLRGCLSEPQRPLGLGFASLLLLPCMLLTRFQITFWENSTQLWEHTLAVTKDNLVAHTNYASSLIYQGRDLDASKELDKALQIDPSFGPVLRMKGGLFEKYGQPDQALSCYRAALAAHPNDPTYRQLVDKLETETRNRQAP